MVQGAVLAGGYQLPARGIAAVDVAGGDVVFILFVDVEYRPAVFSFHQDRKKFS
jgi:hypothetical protein